MKQRILLAFYLLYITGSIASSPTNRLLSSKQPQLPLQAIMSSSSHTQNNVTPLSDQLTTDQIKKYKSFETASTHDLKQLLDNQQAFLAKCIAYNQAEADRLNLDLAGYIIYENGWIENFRDSQSTSPQSSETPTSPLHMGNTASFCLKKKQKPRPGNVLDDIQEETLVVQNKNKAQ